MSSILSYLVAHPEEPTGEEVAGKNPLDDIVDELVVFKHQDPNLPAEQRYVSNSSLWLDSRIKKHWLNKYSDEALAESDEDDSEIVDDPDDDYEKWTNDELREELARRQLSLDGKKLDMVARLREDDDKTEG